MVSASFVADMVADIVIYRDLSEEEEELARTAGVAAVDHQGLERCPPPGNGTVPRVPQRGIFSKSASVGYETRLLDELAPG